jgi:hypothetical protein
MASQSAALSVFAQVATALDERKAPEATARFEGAFVRAEAFTGARLGYVYKHGPAGLGYYVDPLGPLADATAADAAARGPAIDGEELLKVRRRFLSAAAGLQTLPPSVLPGASLCPRAFDPPGRICSRVLSAAAQALLLTGNVQGACPSGTPASSWSS